MKKIIPLLYAFALAALGFAQDAAKKSPPAAGKNESPSIPATAAKVTAPLAVKDGVLALSSTERVEIADGGQAVFEFSVPKDGDYVIYGVVNAPDDESNSFYVNVDVAPKDDPLMIWDIDHTNGFEERVVNWRGNGEAGSGQFSPKVFKLTAGAHKLYLAGREPAKLKSISIRPAKP
jgi:hypothetical protein